MKHVLLSTFVLLAVTSCTHTDSADPAAETKPENAGTLTIVPVSEVNWEKLNPARGDKSPQAGTLWGDRKGEKPTGFLAKFVDGFSSPPHIHNATYRAVVISGLIHNDDPAAEKMWMPPGSFWTQPKGETHITSEKGPDCIALVEIDLGPYLVMPPAEEFDSGERPVNVVPDNIVWSAFPGFSFDGKSPEIAYLWGDIREAATNGIFIKLPPSFLGTIHSEAESFRAVVISGHVVHASDEKQRLDPGSYFGSSGSFGHGLEVGEESTVLYVRRDFGRVTLR